MKYLVTTHENFGVIKEVDRLEGRCEVITDKDLVKFVQKHKPHLITFDGQRAFTNSPEALAEYVYNLKGSFTDYRPVFVFIPVS